MPPPAAAAWEGLLHPKGRTRSEGLLYPGPSPLKATFPQLPTATPLLNWRHTTDPGSLRLSAPTCLKATFPQLPTATPLLNWRHTTGPARPTLHSFWPRIGPVPGRWETQIGAAVALPVVWRRVRRGVALWKIYHGLAASRLLRIEDAIPPVESRTPTEYAPNTLPIRSQSRGRQGLD